MAKGAKLTFKTLTLDVKTIEKSGSDTRVEVNTSQSMDAIGATKQVRISQFTTFTGAPARNALTFSTTASMSR